MTKFRTVKVGQREQLLHAVATGLTTREAAELLWKRPLEETPRPGDFDPLKEEAWSLAMSIAWIVWRSPEAVRSAWTKYRLQCLRWRKNNPKVSMVTINGPSSEDPLDDVASDDLLASDAPSLPKVRRAPSHGWSLASLGAASLSILESEWQSGKWPDLGCRYMKTEAARLKLWGRLSAADLHVSAVHPRTGSVVDIPANEWTHLTGPTLNSDSEEVIGFPDEKERYQDPKVVRRDIVSLWPNKKPDLSEGEPAIGGNVSTERRNTDSPTPRKRSHQLDRTIGILKILQEQKMINKHTKPSLIKNAVEEYIHRDSGIDKTVPDSKTIKKARSAIWGS